MADFPSIGISEEELRDDIYTQVVNYLHALCLANIYEDVEEDLKRIALRGKASQVLIDCVVGNIAEYYKHAKAVSLIRERISTLYHLYKKFFPDLTIMVSESTAGEDAGKTTLEGLLTECKDADDKSYDRLIRRLSVNFSLSLERYFKDEQAKED